MLKAVADSRRFNLPLLRKLHENEEILAQRERDCFPLDPTLNVSQYRQIAILKF